MVSVKNLLAGLIPILAASFSLAAPVDDTPKSDLNKRGFQPPKLEFKVYHGDDPLKAVVAKRDDKVQWPINRGPTFYLANVAVGSDKEEIFVILDTGSSDLWLLEKDAHCVMPGNSKRHGDTGAVGYVYDDEGSLVYSTFFDDFPPLTAFTTIYTTQVLTLYTTKTVDYDPYQSPKTSDFFPGTVSDTVTPSETPSDFFPGTVSEMVTPLETPSNPSIASKSVPLDPYPSDFNFTPSYSVAISTSISVMSNVYPIHTKNGTVYTISSVSEHPTPFTTANILPTLNGESYTQISHTDQENSSKVTKISSTQGSVVTSSTSYYKYSFAGSLITLSPGAQIPTLSISEPPANYTGTSVAPNYPLFSVDGGYITLSPGVVIPTPSNAAESVLTTYFSRLSSMVTSVVQNLLEAKNNSATATTKARSTLIDTPGSSSTILNDGCLAYGSFNPEKSNTFKVNTSSPHFLISYYDNSSASGVWGRDDITLGGVTVKELSFGLVNKTSSTLGVFGIGLRATEVAPTKYDNYPILLKKQGHINKVAYSIYLNSNSAYQGTVLFGAVDHAKYSGILTTVPMTREEGQSPSKMEIPISSWILNLGSENVSLTNTKYSALLDTGTTLTYVPSELFKTISQQLSANYSSDLAAYKVDCSVGLQEFAFNFGQTSVKVPVLNFISQSGTSCTLDIIPQQGTYITFGDNFLTSTYLVYDLEDYTISLAQAKYTDEENVEIINDKIPGASTLDESSSLYSDTPHASGPTSESTAMVHAPLIKRSSGVSALKLNFMTILMGLVISLLPLF
ncbi:Aspartyl protease [Scheffersomyces spartinae]|uniref:candidapepsin n=1 Tax=Scheffersomyces spartinae TaxID=45513 RepID=A0A9P7V666_9ASCO|nr:Aspartyl protease [Scheffersomyces spartinae]KAG7192094.1 Aspartyl protease [Scheffersomyces spartinae]